MNDHTADHVRKLAEELQALRMRLRLSPASWTYRRIAAIEGVLASYHEEAARRETQRIIDRLMQRA